jgi:hypothetical protein
LDGTKAKTLQGTKENDVHDSTIIVVVTVSIVVIVVETVVDDGTNEEKAVSVLIFDLDKDVVATRRICR